MIVESLGISLIIGKLRGGKISRLSSLEIKYWYLFVVAFFIEFGLLFAYDGNISLFKEYAFYFHLISYIILAIGFLLNIENPWLDIAFFGTLLNAMAIFLNGGKMPISLEAIKKAGILDFSQGLIENQVATHQVLSKDMTAWFLGDIIPLIPPYPLPKVISIGDIFISLGIFFLIQSAMLKRDKLFY